MPDLLIELFSEVNSRADAGEGGRRPQAAGDRRARGGGTDLCRGRGGGDAAAACAACRGLLAESPRRVEERKGPRSRAAGGGGGGWVGGGAAAPRTGLARDRPGARPRAAASRAPPRGGAARPTPLRGLLVQAVPLLSIPEGRGPWAVRALLGAPRGVRVASALFVSGGAGGRLALGRGAFVGPGRFSFRHFGPVRTITSEAEAGEGGAEVRGTGRNHSSRAVRAGLRAGADAGGGQALLAEVAGLVEWRWCCWARSTRRFWACPPRCCGPR